MRISDWSSDVCSSDLIEKSLTEGVTAKAYTRYVTVQGRNIGQIVLTGVEKNGRQETLNSSDFTAQFDLTKPQLDPAADVVINGDRPQLKARSEEHTSELQSLMRISYAVFCLKKKKN